MEQVIQRKWKPRFSPAHLKKLQPEFQAEGEKIRLAYEGFKGLVCNYRESLGIQSFVSYRDFLRNDLRDSTVEAFQWLQEVEDNNADDKKEEWLAKADHLMLGYIVQGNKEIDDAYLHLKNGKIADYAGSLANAGVFFGQLRMFCTLIDEGVYDRIGSIKSALFGASLGGTKSGVSRRKQSRVPAPDALRADRQRLIDDGKPERAISAMLAKKYNCTTDHIRKILKRD